MAILNLAKLSVFACSAVNTFSDGVSRLRAVATQIDTDLVPGAGATGTNTSGPGRLAHPTNVRASATMIAECTLRRAPRARLRNIAMIPHYGLPAVTDLYQLDVVHHRRSARV